MNRQRGCTRGEIVYPCIRCGSGRRKSPIPQHDKPFPTPLLAPPVWGGSQDHIPKKVASPEAQRARGLGESW
jgi:hypothetical protein